MIRIAPRLLATVFLLLVAVYLTASVSDPSFYFHLAIGQWIHLNRTLPWQDHWSMLGSGKRWLADAWLFDLSIQGAEQLFGTRGFALVSLAGSAAFVLSLGSLLRLLTGELAISSIVAIMIACGCLERAELSPDVWAWTIFALASQLCCRPLSSKRRNLGLFLCGAVLTNLHQSFLLLPVWVLFLVSGSTGKRFVAVLTVLASAFASPYFGLQIFQHALGSVRAFELMVRFRESGANAFLFSFAFLILLWIIFLLLIPRFRGFSEPSLLIFSGMLSFAGLIHRDLLPYALLVCGMLTAKILAWGLQASEQQGEAPAPLIEALRRLAAGIKRVPAVGGLWVLFCLLFVNVVSALKSPLVDVFLPRQALDTFFELGISGPLLHERNIGPYLVYRFSHLPPEKKLLAVSDDRLPLFSMPLTVAEHALRTLQPGWEKYFEAVQPRAVLCRKGTALFEILSASSSWKLIYQDGSDALASEEVEVTLPPKIPAGYGWVLFQRA